MRSASYVCVNGEKEIHKITKDRREKEDSREERSEGRRPGTIPRGSAGLFKRIQLSEMALLKVTFRIDIADGKLSRDYFTALLAFLTETSLRIFVK